MVVEELIDALGNEIVMTSEGSISNYAFDWTGQWYAQPLAVVEPNDSEGVATALRICSAHVINVVTQGGNSGLVGGSVGNNHPHIILSTKKLRTEPVFDHATHQLTLGAGFTLKEVQDIASSHGLQYPVDTASRALATIGGTVATNAGGVRVIAFGMTGEQVVGVKLVLSDGTIIDRLHRLAKENTGFDITSLAIASEGTLGVITDVCLQLQAPRVAQWTAMIPCVHIRDALSIALPIQGQLLAAEIFQTRAANTVAANEGMKLLPDHTDWWLILEGDGEKPELRDGTIWAMNSGEAAKYWNYRELQSTMLNRMSNVVKIDTSVRPMQLPSFIDEITQALNTGENLYVFGHLLDGNLHIAVTNVEDKSHVSDIVIKSAVNHHGSISAEHGIGQAKNQYLQLVRSPRELELMQAVRKSFDPAGIMNQHVLKPTE
jgi:FAD/FMN-containing dehydrogenase